jgi:hypothetical protein
MLAKYLFTAGCAWFISAVCCAQNFTSSNLPIVVINTNGQTIPDDPKITADMGIIFNGAGVRNNLADAYNHYNGKVGIEVRGKSSQSFPMKSYSVELRDVAGASVNKSILGMPAESDWVLYAPYTDKTLMHNFLAYTISNELGHWAAHCRYVEVVLNNNYVGVYVLLEKIKRGASRVDIPKLKTTDISGDALTGGYIFKIDKEDPGDDGWYSQFTPNNPSGGQKIKFLYEYPKAADIVTEQKNYIKAYTDSFENSLKSTAYQDPVTGYRKYADLNSFVDYFIVNEVSRNVDGYRLSSFFYKDKKSKGGKIIAGPVWDYDLAFRNANYCNGSNIDDWSYKFNTICNGDYWLVPFWWDRLMQDSNFNAALHCRWKQLRQTTLSNDHLNFLIDSVNTLLGEAQPRHFQRWPILGQYIWPNPQPIATTYAGELNTLKQWLNSRLQWIDNNVPNTGSCMDWPAGLNSSMNIKLYPSPFKSNIHLWVQTKTSQQLTIQVSNAAGQVVMVKTISTTAGINSITDFATDNWGTGVYDFYILNNEGEKFLKKAVRL